MCVYISECMCVCMCMFVGVHACMCVCMYVCVCIYVHEHPCMSVCVRVHACDSSNCEKQCHKPSSQCSHNREVCPICWLLLSNRRGGFAQRQITYWWWQTSSVSTVQASKPLLQQDKRPRLFHRYLSNSTHLRDQFWHWRRHSWDWGLWDFLLPVSESSWSRETTLW